MPSQLEWQLIDYLVTTLISGGVGLIIWLLRGYFANRIDAGRLALQRLDKHEEDCKQYRERTENTLNELRKDIGEVRKEIAEVSKHVARILGFMEAKGDS